MTALDIKWQGLETVLKNLNKEIKGIKKRSAKGVTRAALHLRRVSMPLTPVVEGNLRNSAYTIGPTGSSGESASFSGEHSPQMARQHSAAFSESSGNIDRGDNPSAIVGYSASYAAFVHENPRAGQTGGISPRGVKYKPPKGSRRKVYSTVGQYKFLEQPLITEHDEILKIIKENAKL